MLDAAARSDAGPLQQPEQRDHRDADLRFHGRRTTETASAQKFAERDGRVRDGGALADPIRPPDREPDRVAKCAARKHEVAAGFRKHGAELGDGSSGEQRVKSAGEP